MRRILLGVAALIACHADDPVEARARTLAAPLLSVSAGDTVKQIAKRDSAVAESLKVIAPLVRARKQPVATAARLDSLRAYILRPVVVTDTGVVAVTDTTVITPPPPPPPPTNPATCGVTDWSPRTQPAFGKPGYLQSVTDPVFGTTITRITGDPGTTIPTIGGTWPNMVKQNYPKDPVWTADEKMMVLKIGFPNSAALFLDGTTYQPLFMRSGPSGGGEWRLHPTIPDVAVVIRADGTISHWNVRTNTMTTKVAAVSGYTSNTFGPYEGNLSRDGRYLVAQATRSDGHLVARVIDVDGGVALNVIDLTGAGIAAPLDWVSISASGNYVVAFDASQYMWVWNRSTGALVWHWTDMKFGHNDLGLDAGNDVAFGAEASGTYAKRFITRRLDNGAITVLSPATSFNWHASTRGPVNEGFAATNDLAGPTAGEVYAIGFDGTPHRLAHHRAINQAYNDAPHPVPSPDGQRVAFSSNWGTAGGSISAFVISCP